MIEDYDIFIFIDIPGQFFDAFSAVVGGICSADYHDLVIDFQDLVLHDMYLVQHKVKLKVACGVSSVVSAISLVMISVNIVDTVCGFDFSQRLAGF